MSPIAISELVWVGTLSQAKALGGVGSMLTILTVVPLLGAVLGSVGFILILVAMKQVSDAMHDKYVYINMLIATTTSIGGLLLTSLIVVRAMVRFVGLKNAVGILPFGPSFGLQPFNVGDPVGLFFAILPALFLIWIVMITSVVFMRKAYESMAARLNNKMFRTAGWVYAAGSSTTIILVGFGLLVVAQVVLARAFFLMVDDVPTRPIPRVGVPMPPPPPPV
jgi:uncharacterized membrane protein